MPVYDFGKARRLTADVARQGKVMLEHRLDPSPRGRLLLTQEALWCLFGVHQAEGEGSRRRLLDEAVALWEEENGRRLGEVGKRKEGEGASGGEEAAKARRRGGGSGGGVKSSPFLSFRARSLLSLLFIELKSHVISKR